MAWTGLTLTVDGRNALNQAQQANTMNIKSVVIGDGAAPSNYNTRKELVHQLYELTELKIDMTNTGCNITVDLPRVDYDYYFREIGVIVTNEDHDVLYVYDNCGEDAQYIINSTGAEENQKRIRLSLVISDVSHITVSTPSILYVAYDEFESEVNDLQDKKLDADGDASNAYVNFTYVKDLEELVTGDKFSRAFGKIARAISDLMDHIKTKASSTIAGHVKLSNSSAITDAGQYALDAVEKNASVEGSLANQISKMSGNLVTGIKGESEKEYRTGDVNLTAENIGAVASYGGTLDGGVIVDTPVMYKTAASPNAQYGMNSNYASLENINGINVGYIPGTKLPETGFGITSKGIDVFGNLRLNSSTANGRKVGKMLFGSNNDTYYIDSNGVAYLKCGTFDNTITLLGGLKSENSMYMANNKVLYAYNSNGAARSIIHFTSKNELFFGYGSYAANEGSTYICGKDVEIYFVRSSGAGVGYRPYYKAGDSFTIALETSGYITGGSKDVRFTVSLSRPVIASTVSVSSVAGLRVRQGNKYCYGSTSSTMVAPSSYSATLSENGSAIYIDATMANTTNVTTNNDACGVDATIKITIS